MMTYQPTLSERPLKKELAEKDAAEVRRLLATTKAETLRVAIEVAEVKKTTEEKLLSSAAL